MVCLKNLEDEISAWPHASIRPHRFGGRKFRFGNAEVGHMHTSAVVDIPFPRSIQDVPLNQGLADEHHWVPNSGWITFRVRNEVRNENDLKHGLGLVRLSYLRHALKTASASRRLLEQESEGLHLNHRFTALFEPFMSKTANVSTGPFSA